MAPILFISRKTVVYIYWTGLGHMGMAEPIIVATEI